MDDSAVAETIGMIASPGLAEDKAHSSLLKESRRDLITVQMGSSNTIVLVFPLAQAFTPGLAR